LPARAYEHRGESSSKCAAADQHNYPDAFHGDPLTDMNFTKHRLAAARRSGEEMGCRGATDDEF
jgi:hypothetical protein